MGEWDHFFWVFGSVMAFIFFGGKVLQFLDHLDQVQRDKAWEGVTPTEYDIEWDDENPRPIVPPRSAIEAPVEAWEGPDDDGTIFEPGGLDDKGFTVLRPVKATPHADLELEISNDGRKVERE